MAVGEKLSKGIARRLENYLPNVFLIWLFILIYRTSPYYKEFLRAETQSILLGLAIAYTLYGAVRLFIFPIASGESKGKIIFSSSGKIVRTFFSYAEAFSEGPKKRLPKITHEEKRAILFALVKAFFLPVMINFFLSNGRVFLNFWASFVEQGFPVNVEMFNIILYPLLFNLLFLIDTAFFVFGYSVESKALGNEVRSVEPTLLGWLVALVCYPPFNGFLGTYVNWYPNDFASFGTESQVGALLTLILRCAFLVLIGIYVWATVALGTKCSNLTNRGIVSSGPYAFVRHPAYISKNLAWLIMTLPLFRGVGLLGAFSILLSVSAWAFIYFLRAITEERHLIKDPDYAEYCRKVRHRFIPGLF